MAAADAFHGDLTKVLLKEKVLTQDVLQEALREHEKSKDSLLDVLLRLGKCDERMLCKVLSSEFGFTQVNPSVFVIDPELIELIPEDKARKYTALPIAKLDNTLTVAFANPTNIASIDELHLLTGLRIKAVIGQQSILKKYIDKYYSKDKGDSPAAEESGTDENESMDDLVKMIEVEQESMSPEDVSDLMKVANETPVIKLVNIIVTEGIKRQASDIFIEPWEENVRVRVRVDGLLEEVMKPPKNLASALVSRIKVMSDLNIAEHRIPQDGRFKVRINDRQVDMRVSILPTVHGEKVCLRILDTSNQSHDIEKLGFTVKEQQIIKDSSLRPHGMILVTGPTGSGKTTTLYSVLKYLDKPEVNITTVEDPVEYQMIGINQVNVRDQIGLTFPAALRSILRQDPDIVLIGEIRDAETLDIAVKAALTGHLVLSTLHTNDAASSITRMVNMGLEPFLIASTVIMISAQRLVRRVCPRCKFSYELEAPVLKQLNLDPKTQKTFYKGKGCVQCRQSGYQGRSVITELLEMTPQILKAVMRGKTSEEIKAIAHHHGMTTLRECALNKALQGETSLEEVYRVTSEDQGLDKYEDDDDSVGLVTDEESAA